MNLHNMEHLSLDERSRRQQPNHISLPPIDTFIGTAGRGEGIRLLDQPTILQPTRALHYGQSPQHGAGHAQSFTPYHAAHGQLNNSIESVPSTAFSSPRMMASNNYFDTSSVSSSSRESSVYSGTPSSSANTVRVAAASGSRSTRAKRGSESQGSGRDRKRPSMSSNAGPLSEDECGSWCDTCHTPFRNCSTPKEHERKGKKIVKEKAARNKQAQVLQKIEDLHDNVYDLTPLKTQMPGNQKKSGLEHDKQELFEVTLLVLDRQFQRMASNLSTDVLEQHRNEVNQAIRDHILAKGDDGLYKGSLLASESGTDACPHEGRGSQCDNPIPCRKRIHARNFADNLARITESLTAATAPTVTLQLRSSRPASTPRRSNL